MCCLRREIGDEKSYYEEFNIRRGVYMETNQMQDEEGPNSD